MRIGISACLIGQPVRYDGRDKYDPYIIHCFENDVEWEPVCPEVEAGLPVPREKMNLQGDPACPRIVTVETGVDYTGQILRWVETKLEYLAERGISGFILKGRSPSCGLRKIPVIGDDGRERAYGMGIFAGRLVQRFPDLPVLDEEEIRDEDKFQEFRRRTGTL